MRSVPDVPIDPQLERERLVQDAKDADAFLKALAPDANAPLNKRSLVEYGRYYWPITYKHFSNHPPQDVDCLAVSYLEHWIRHQEPVERMILDQLLRMPDQAIAIFGAARWHNEGRPLFRIGHKRAAALMATSCNKISEFVEPPFSAFYIELPSDLLPLLDHDGSYKPAIGILVQRQYLRNFKINGEVQPDGYRWNWVALTGHALIQWHLNRTATDLVSADEQNDWQGVGIPLSEYDARVSLLIGRLICGVCLSMQDSEESKKWKRRTETLKNPDARGAKKSSGAPTFQAFVDKTIADFDAREYIRSVLTGQRRSSSGIYDVERYYRLQHYGPGNSLSKITRVKSHQRGFKSVTQGARP